MKIPQATSQHVMAGVLSKQRCVSYLRNYNNSDRRGKPRCFVSWHNTESAIVYLLSF